MYSKSKAIGLPLVDGWQYTLNGKDVQFYDPAHRNKMISMTKSFVGKSTEGYELLYQVKKVKVSNPKCLNCMSTSDSIYGELIIKEPNGESSKLNFNISCSGSD